MSSDNLIFDGYPISVDTPIPTAICITGENSEPLLMIKPDGTVEAPSLEAAGEAGRVFVEHVRKHMRVVSPEPGEWQVEAAMKAFALIAHDMAPEQYDEDRKLAAEAPLSQKRVEKSLRAMAAALRAASIPTQPEGVEVKTEMCGSCGYTADPDCPICSPPTVSGEVTDEWLRDTAMNVMLATEVEEAVRILRAELKAGG